MIYVPDTNAFSAYLAGRWPQLTERMRLAFAAREPRLSVMVLAELAFGAEKIRAKLNDTKFIRRVEALRKQLEVEPLGESFAGHYAAVRLHLESAGQMIGRDTIIAAHALALGAVMVTRNVGESERVPGLKVETGKRLSRTHSVESPELRAPRQARGLELVETAERTIFGAAAVEIEGESNSPFGFSLNAQLSTLN
jgi:tRNA(fMet)-specific endonuclease VapC